MTVENILSNISNWSVVIPFFAGIISIKKLTKNTMLVFVAVSLAVIPQLMNAFHLQNEAIKNFTYNAYTPLEFLVFYFLFDQYILGKTERIISKMLLVLYLVISIHFITDKNFTLRFFDEWDCINNLIYTMWILFIFYQQYRLSETLKIDTASSVFWIFTGLLFYAPCSTLYFSVYPYAQQPNFSSLKSIHHIVNTNMYICFALGVYKDSLSVRNKI